MSKQRQIFPLFIKSTVKHPPALLSASLGVLLHFQNLSIVEIEVERWLHLQMQSVLASNPGRHLARRRDILDIMRE